VLLTSLQRAYSFSGASGSCFGGINNIFGPHTLQFGDFGAAINIQTGSLAAGGVQVLFDGDPLATDGVFTFNEGKDYSIRVVGDSDYKGILIRLETTEVFDTTAALVEDSDLLSPATVCTPPIVGLNHNSAELKNNQGGTLRLNAATALTLDITVVNVLDGTDSVFYYSRFALEALPAPSGSPSLTPSMAPSITPTISSQPSFLPTGSPSEPPSATPSENPSEAPSQAPSFEPSGAPSTSPSVAPTSAPSNVPSLAPSATPSVAPTAIPTTVPSATPSGIPSASPTKVPSSVPSTSPTSGPSGIPSRSPSESPSFAPSNGPSRAPSKQPSPAPSPRPTTRPTRAPTEQPSQSPTKSTQPSVFCLAVGSTCTVNDRCCGEGANICIGVCSRVIGVVSKDLDKTQFKLSDDARVRGSDGFRLSSELGRVRGSDRRKLLKGSHRHAN
jgi:hypothetical protein